MPSPNSTGREPTGADRSVPKKTPVRRNDSNSILTVAVTGGKGGVGKTSVSVNLATACAAGGKRVMLLDGDLGLANVDVFLGLSPHYTLAHVLRGERTLEEVIVDTPQGFQIVPAASGVTEMVNMGVAE